MIIMRRRVRFRFIIFVLLAILAPAYFFLSIRLVNDYRYVYIQTGDMIHRETGDALIVRSDYIHILPEHTKADHDVSEGAFLEEGADIPHLTTDESIDALLSDLENIRNQIFHHQKDILLISEHIYEASDKQAILNNKLRELQKFVKYDMPLNMDIREDEIRSVFADRQRSLDKITPLDAILSDLYEQEAELIKKVTDLGGVTNIPKAGIVSFHSDGLESAFNFESLNDLSIDAAQSLLSNSRASRRMESPEFVSFIRIVGEDRWFLVCIIQNSRAFYYKNDIASIRFLCNYEVEYRGIVYKALRDNTTSMVIFEVREDVQHVLNLRTAKVEIKSEDRGLMVPNEAIYEYDGFPGLTIIIGDKSEFSPVRILAEGDKYAIIEVIDEDTMIESNTRIKLR